MLRKMLFASPSSTHPVDFCCEDQDPRSTITLDAELCQQRWKWMRVLVRTFVVLLGPQMINSLCKATHKPLTLTLRILSGMTSPARQKSHWQGVLSWDAP